MGTKKQQVPNLGPRCLKGCGLKGVTTCWSIAGCVSSTLTDRWGSGTHPKKKYPKRTLVFCCFSSPSILLLLWASVSACLLTVHTLFVCPFARMGCMTARFFEHVSLSLRQLEAYSYPVARMRRFLPIKRCVATTLFSIPRPKMTRASHKRLLLLFFVCIQKTG